MKNKIKYILLVLCLTLIYKVGVSQENYASNISTSISDDEKLLITYDIKANDGTKSFRVILMLTHNGTKIQTDKIYGDVGSVEAGSEKAIVWYFKGDFEGNINDVKVDVFADKVIEPQAIFKIVSISNNGYAPCEIVVSNSSSYANEYQWDFGDPTSGAKNMSFEKDPSHTFKNSGIFPIALIARNTQLKLENTFYHSIEIKAHENTVADFQIEGNNQLPPAKVKFKSKSVNADTYKWNFGDPASKKKNESDEKDTEHKYSQAGTYTVELTVMNNFSKITNKITKELVVEQEKLPVAKFTFSKSSETAPSTVIFKNTSSSSDNYKWEFGDAAASGNKNESTDVDPAHVFTKAGNFNVTLSAYAKGEKKPATYSETIIIKELPKPPVARFVIQNNNVFGPATIVFKNNSENATNYNWDFGDPGSGSNNSSDKEAPTHTYTSAGRYKVVLIATSPDFKEVGTVSDFVVITEPTKPPVAKFNISNNNINSPAKISFYNETINADNYFWDFGDPTSGENSSADQSPKHNFTKAGRYKVVLTATNKKTGEKSISSDFVIITEPVKPVILPEASFGIENNNIPCPAIVSFTNKSVNAHSYNWNFGDPSSKENNSVIKNPTHVYSTAGRYMVSLKAKNDNSGETSNFTEFVVVTEPAKRVIRPVAQFNVEHKGNTAPAKITFSGTSTDADTYEWNFGDFDAKNNTSSESNPSHIYEKAGRYKVELKVTNKTAGLSNTFSDFITISAPLIIPEANFEIGNNKTVEPATIAFKNTTINANSYAWNFGDPLSGDKNTSTLETPQHIYNTAGEYKVLLAVLNKESGKEDVIEKTVTVEKRAVPPTANFEITFNGEFVPINIQFKNISTNADTYNWNFGDFDSETNSSKDFTPTHLYTQSGLYKITLDVSNSKTGETSNFTKEVSLKSNFPTFVISGKELGDNEMASSLVATSNDEYLVILNNNERSSVVKLKNNGEIKGEETFEIPIHHIISTGDNNKFLMLGLNKSGDLVVQSINDKLKTGNQVLLPENKKFKYDFGAPKFALSRTNEVGIIANTIDDKYPLSIIFQKIDKSGRIIPKIDRTFKYIGTKLATDIIPVEDGGFALTGYWKAKTDDPTLILFGKIDSKGLGELHLIGSDLNNIGYDIEQSFEAGFAVLRAKENKANSDMYEISFIIVDNEGEPTECANLLPCTIKKEDILNYEPAMIKTNDGYVIACHAFNGIDYDVRLFWIDKSGNILINYRDIILSNDQFVMDVKQSTDGGLMIIGTERTNGKHRAFVIKTDASGKINP